VLPIGGVKEKVIAAKRSRVSHVLLPYDNRKDFDELEPQIKEGMHVTYCKEYRDVFKAVFENKRKRAPVSQATTAAVPEPTAVVELDDDMEVEDTPIKKSEV
jgi:predicted ATP-dependent protease